MTGKESVVACFIYRSRIFVEELRNNTNVPSHTTVFWNVTPRGLVDFYRRFGRTFCVQLEGRKVSRTGDWQAAAGDTTAVNYLQTARCHIQDSRTVHSQHCKNLQSSIFRRHNGVNRRHLFVCCWLMQCSPCWHWPTYWRETWRQEEMAVVTANSHTGSVRARARPYDVPAAQKVCHVRAQASSTARTSNLHAARVATGERYEGDVPVFRQAQGV